MVIVSNVSSGVSDISIVSNVSIVVNVSIVRILSSVSNVSIVCNSKKKKLHDNTDEYFLQFSLRSAKSSRPNRKLESQFSIGHFADSVCVVSS